MATLLKHLGQPGRSADLTRRYTSINVALHRHCFDGSFFSDGLASYTESDEDYSVHSQVWAVSAGAISGAEAIRILRDSIQDHGKNAEKSHQSESRDAASTQPSTAMSFYTLRALSKASRALYNDHFHRFWYPWKAQLDLNATTWVEDSVNQRSDCHAWGSSPPHEFLTEVTGIKPGAPGWAIVEFQPRIELYEELDATVVVTNRGKPILARVSWRRSGGDTVVILEFTPTPGADHHLSDDTEMRVIFPSGEAQNFSEVTASNLYYDHGLMTISLLNGRMA